MANVLQSAQQFFKNKFQDDEGFFRQGRFTPGRQISEFAQRAAPVVAEKAFTPFANLQRATQRAETTPRTQIRALKGRTLPGKLVKGFAESYVNIPRNIFVGSTRLGNLIGEATRGKPKDAFTRAISGVAPIAESLLDVYVPGAAKGLVKQTSKQLIKTGIKTGLKQGITEGALTGAAIELGRDPRSINLGETLKSTLAGGLFGGAFGGIIGGGSAAIGQLTKGIAGNIRKIDPGLSSKQATKEARRYIQLEGGRMAGSTPKFKSKKDVKFVGDIRESIGLSRFGDEIPQLGQGTRKVSPLESKVRQQELNVKRLRLSPEAKKVVQSVEGTEPRVRLRNKDILELAKQVTGDDKVRLKEGTAKNIAAQLNTRKRLVSLTNEYQALKTGGASNAVLKARMIEIGKFSKVARTQGTDVARRLQARTILANELDTPMQRVFKLLDNAGIKQKDYIDEAVGVDFNNAKSVTDFFRKFVPPKFGEWLDEFRYTNMLSSPRTHITNFVSNTIQTAVQPVRKVVAGGFDWAISGLTGKERTQFAGEAGQFVKKALTSLPDAWKSATDVIEGKQAITHLDLNRIPSGSKFMRTYSTPLRVLEAGDAFFKTILGEGQEAALKFRKGKLKTKAGNAEITKQAQEYASEALFRGGLNKQGQGWLLNAVDGLTSLINKTRHSRSGLVRGIGKTLIPFVQTPMNILKQGVEYSPVGFANAINSKGNIPDQLAKATIGSMVMLGAGSIISGGNSTWETPTGAKEREAFFASGKQPYSIKMGDKWVSYTKLGPLSYPIAMAGAVNEALKARGDDELASATAGKVIAMMGAFFTDQSYMRSVGDIIDAMRGDKFKQTRMVANVPTQLVPFKSFVGWVNRMVDPIYRKVDWSGGIPGAVAQSIQRDIPFVSKGLEPYTDPLGDPSQRQFPLINAVSPFNITEEKEEFTGVYNKIVGDRRARKAEKNAEASILAGAGTREINDKLMFVVDDEVVKLDFGKIADMPTGNALERVKKEKAKFTFIGKLMESGADDVDIDNALKKVGVTREDAEYYNIARNTNDAKSAYVFESLADVETREEMFELLVAGRRKINGKLVVSDGVIDELFREGVITTAEKKWLKSIKQGKSGQLTTGRATGTGKKAPKPAFRKTSPGTVSRIKLPTRKASFKTKPLNLQVNLQRTQPRVRLRTPS